MFPQTILAALLLVPAGAETVWIPSDIDSRRLATYVSSHTDITDQNCVVGGYDPVSTIVRVGGPCSLFNPATSQPLNASFRYVSMLTVYCDFTSNVVPGMLIPTGYHMLQSQNLATHAEVGTLGTFRFALGATPAARVFASQTSYLAKSQVTFNSVDFVIGGNQTAGTFDKVNACTQACCATPPCTCTGCPTTMTTASAGNFKYSIFAATYDDPASGTNGWQTMVTAAGGQITGAFNVYQYVDFTNMFADAMTITHGGSDVLYTQMAACAYATLLLGGCTWTSVSKISLAATGWAGLKYEFPTAYNRGSWTKSAAGTTTTTVSDTKTVEITAIKPDAAWVNSLSSGSTRLILLRYKFDISGATATNDGNSGTWFAYDPSVTNNAAPASNSNSGSSSGSNSGSSSGSGSNPSPGTTSGSVSRSSFVALSMAAWFMWQSCGRSFDSRDLVDSDGEFCLALFASGKACVSGNFS